jgi:hypothetical protein
VQWDSAEGHVGAVLLAMQGPDQVTFRVKDLGGLRLGSVEFRFGQMWKVAELVG